MSFLPKLTAGNHETLNLLVAIPLSLVGTAFIVFLMQASGFGA